MPASAPTTRARLDRHRRLVLFLFAGGFFVSAALFAIAIDRKDDLPLPLWLLFALAIAAHFSAYVVVLSGGRCGECGIRIAWIAKLPPWRLPGRLKFCPYCGGNIDRLESSGPG